MPQRYTSTAAAKDAGQWRQLCWRSMATPISRSIGLALYSFAFRSGPEARHVDAAVRALIKGLSAERAAQSLKELEAELERPTEQLNCALPGLQKSDEECRKFLRLVVAAIRARLPVEMPEEDASKWREKLASYKSVSALLRDLAREYSATRNDVGVMLYGLFDDFSQDELMHVWHWDLEGSGKGLTDAQLDQSLSHLLQARPAAQ